MCSSFISYIPNEILVRIFKYCTSNWQERYNLIRVCKKWKEIICYNDWDDYLPLKTNYWPPFYNVKGIKIQKDCSISLMNNIKEKYKNIKKLEFGMFHTIKPKDANDILKSLLNFNLDTIIIGSAKDWINSSNIQYIMNCSNIILSNCSNLTSNDLLYLSNCISLNISFPKVSSIDDNISDNGFINLKSLTSLNISGRRKLSDNCLEYLCDLNDLSIDYCCLTGRNFYKLTKLNRLSCCKCSYLEVRYIQSLSSLTYIDISNNISLSNNDLQYLSHISIIKLNNCSGISGNGLQYLINTKELHLNKCTQLVDTTIEYIPESILYLYLRGCNKLTDKIFDNLSKTLKLLNIRKCPLISQKSIENINLSNKSLIILSNYDYRIKK